MRKLMCNECGYSSEKLVLNKVVRRYQGDDYDFELEVEVPFCEKCGSPLYDKKIEQDIRSKANQIIREKRKIISKQEILDLVSKYNVSQKFLSKVLGWGEVTLPRYIKGNYTPSIENSNKLRSIENPYILSKLVDENIDDREEFVSLKEKLKENINKELLVLEKCKGKIYEVVDWFLVNVASDEGITHLALQKALYFVQSWSYIFNGEWIFKDDCEAWVHGAVYRDIYEEFKEFKHNNLPKISKESSLTHNEIRVLEFVKEKYLDVYTARTLEKICHYEEPFKLTRGDLDEKAVSCRIIKKEDILRYYQDVSEKYNISADSQENVNRYISDLLFYNK